jgi:Dyp-type peroxidase family
MIDGDLRMAIDRANVQGLILRGYNYPFSRHLLLHFPDAKAGKSFLAWARPRITNGAEWAKGVKPAPLLNLGLTFEGLKAIGLAGLLRGIDANLVVDPDPTWPQRNPFPEEFVNPPSPGSIGDLEEPDDPKHWWNQKFDGAMIHASLHVYTRSSEAALDAIVDEARKQAAASGVVELVSNPDGSPLGGAVVSGGKVHFGYVDGVGQPDVDWETIPATPGKVDLRHFLLGYDLPEIPSSPRQGLTGDLFRDGTYMGFRWLSQDVPEFEAYLDRNAALVAPGRPIEEGRELLAAKLVGRWRDGTPLVLSPDRPDPTLVGRAFAYATDADGARCPFSAHIRASNPRDQPLNPVVQLGVPRLLRRGSSYGPEWVPGKNDKADRGLIGLFLCASLDRQFLQILRWMNANTFSPVFDGETQGRQDPLFGTESMRRSPTFRIPGPGGGVEVPLPRPFVHSRGTAYFLLPALRTLDRFLGAS